MKWKLLSIFTALVLTLMACQTQDDTSRGTDNPNIDPTNYRNQTGDDMLNNRDYTMDRDAERYQNRGDRANRNNDSNYEVANEAADKITDQIDDIDSAYVLTTDNNAYVAANLDADNDNRMNNDNNTNRNNNNNNNRDNDRDSDDLTDEVKEEIADIVKSVNRDIDNVYVSTNPDFVNLANDYADDVDRGEPIEGFFEQFGTMIERLFPENGDR